MTAVEALDYSPKVEVNRPENPQPMGTMARAGYQRGKLGKDAYLPIHCSQVGVAGVILANKNMDATGPRQQILVTHL